MHLCRRCRAGGEGGNTDTTAATPSPTAKSTTMTTLTTTTTTTTSTTTTASSSSSGSSGGGSAKASAKRGDAAAPVAMDHFVLHPAHLKGHPHDQLAHLIRHRNTFYPAAPCSTRRARIRPMHPTRVAAVSAKLHAESVDDIRDFSLVQKLTSMRPRFKLGKGAKGNVAEKRTAVVCSGGCSLRGAA